MYSYIERQSYTKEGPGPYQGNLRTTVVPSVERSAGVTSNGMLKVWVNWKNKESSANAKRQERLQVEVYLSSGASDPEDEGTRARQLNINGGGLLRGSRDEFIAILIKKGDQVRRE